MTPVLCESFNNNNNNTIHSQSKMPDFVEFPGYEYDTSSHSDAQYQYNDASEEAFETSENEGSIDMGSPPSDPGHVYTIHGYPYSNQPYSTVYYDSPLPNYESHAFQEAIPENYISTPPASQNNNNSKAAQRKGKGGRKKNLHPPTPVIMKHRRNMANARERKRMNGLNDAFERLREVVPNVNTEQKMSKIETLLVAQTYIKALAKLMDSENESEQQAAN